MNIFTLSNKLNLQANVTETAQWHTDRHVVSQIKETAQLISNAVIQSKSELKLELIKADIHVPCNQLGAGHNNHPCAKWLRLDEDETQLNYHRIAYLAALGEALCLEKLVRWPFNPLHMYHTFFINLNGWFIREYKLASPPPAFPIAIKDCPWQGEVLPLEQAVYWYRQYYIEKKQSQAKWSNQLAPYWYKFEAKPA